jgi:hypothetical protein
MVKIVHRSNMETLVKLKLVDRTNLHGNGNGNGMGTAKYSYKLST